jgi:hypothetical protein
VAVIILFFTIIGIPETVTLSEKYKTKHQYFSSTISPAASAKTNGI